MVIPQFFGIITAVTCTKQTAPDTRHTTELQWSPQTCRSSVCNLFHVTFCHLRDCKWFLDFWKICGFLIQIFYKARTYLYRRATQQNTGFPALLVPAWQKMLRDLMDLNSSFSCMLCFTIISSKLVLDMSMELHLAQEENSRLHAITKRSSKVPITYY